MLARPDRNNVTVTAPAFADMDAAAAGDRARERHADAAALVTALATAGVVAPQDRAHLRELSGRPRTHRRGPDSVSELLRHVDHVVDGSLHEIVRQVDAATLGGHHT